MYSGVINYILDTGSTHTTVKDDNDLSNLFKSKILRMTSSTGYIIDYTNEGTLAPFNSQAYYNKHKLRMRTCYMTFVLQIALD